MAEANEKLVAHTPGPWTVQRSPGLHDGQYDYAINGAGAPILAEAFGLDCKGNIIPAEANARLIAAAPEMHEALKAAESVLRMLTEPTDEQLKMSNLQAWTHSVEVSRKCMDALAKAEAR